MSVRAGYVLGIDAGASSVKVVALALGGEAEREGAAVGGRAGTREACGEGALLYRERAVHHGDVLACLGGMLARAVEALGAESCCGVCTTGSGAHLILERCEDFLHLEDVPAAVLGAELLAPGAHTVMEIGAQDACFIGSIAPGRAPEFVMNESCASGTGSFFEDQMTRLGLKIEDFSGLVAGAASVPRISGRCSVFAKTDIIHRQQEGVPVEDILLGLCYAMVKSYKALIVRGAVVKAPVALAGGVLLNEGVVRAVREVFDLGEGELIVGEDNLYLKAVGAAREAAKQVTTTGSGRNLMAKFVGADSAVDEITCQSTIPTFQLASALELLQGKTSQAQDLPRLAALPDSSYEAGCGFVALPREQWQPAADGCVHATLGIDVGSTSTNLVLLDREGRVLDAQYLRTAGDARNAIREGLASLAARLGDTVQVDAVTTTGSGRNLMAKFVGADSAIDEITCQAAGAAHVDPQVDTIFEIGGQDSKFISLAGGEVVDFQMNKVCAAGTGSFIEEQAARLGIPLGEYGTLALSAEAPIDLGERCTVFVETAINAALGAGASKADVAAGLALSIVRNYLHRVVGSKHVGEHIVLQGGVAYNPAIVEAFRSFWGGKLTVSPNFAVSGAVGAALMAARAAEQSDFAGTSFKGFDLAGAERAQDKKLAEAVALNRAFYEKTEELFLAGYTGERDPNKKTVGVPRCLMLHRLFPMANGFFKTLGYNVVLSDNTTEELVRLAQENARGETCYPVKLIYGHMAKLADEGVDYIFMPSLHTIRHASSKVAHNYACVYMQTAPKLVANALRFEERGIKLLNPTLDMDFGQQSLATAMLTLGTSLGHTPQETARAMMAGGFAVTEFGNATERLGEELLNSLGPDERVLVLITRNYGISDNALNMGIPEILLDHGQKVITLSHLHGHDIDVSEDHPGICWPFGQHILSGAKLVRRDPRLFAVYLTNHGCGPDTMLDKQFAEEMGDKPYLHIECDEHFSSVGVITRVEAFLNSLSHLSKEDAVRLSTPEGEKPVESGCCVCGCGCEPVGEGDGAGAAAHEAPNMALSQIPEGGEVPVAATNARLVLPEMGAYGKALAALLCERGFDATVMPLDAAALAAGRAATSEKEYCSFTALLGMSLLAAEQARADGKDLHLVLPATRGAEADNQFERSIRAILRARGYVDVKIWAPRFETLPWVLDATFGESASDRFFEALLEADATTAKAGVSGTASCAAGDAATAAQHSLMLVGEWPLVYSDELTGGLAQHIEDRGYNVVRMPAAEWFWMLWADEYNEDKTFGNHEGAQGMPWEKAMPAGSAVTVDFPSAEELERRKAKLDAWQEQLVSAGKQLQAQTGTSPYEANPTELISVADKYLLRFAGGNARYRLAKQELVRTRMAGVVTVASLYENADIMLRLKEESLEVVGDVAPVLHLNFDGVLDQSIDEKLASYLYYV